MSQADGISILPRDYLMTTAGLYFAVVLPASAPGTFICSLRYVRGAGDEVRKLDTRQACRFLKTRHPRFLGYSKDLDCEAVSVQRSDAIRVYKPVEARERIEHASNPDALEARAIKAITYLKGKGIETDYLGITGSLMLGFHNAGSDIDVVIYDKGSFNLARQAIGESIATGELSAPDETMWLEIYHRRGCALDFHDYMKHEKRKYNKFILDNTKVDISYVPAGNKSSGDTGPVKKLGMATIKARVVDASRSFEYPACYIVDSNTVEHIYCYTATYTGQALAGEHIEAAGMIEVDAGGRHYMVIGTSREAPGEYLRVIGL